MLFGKNKQTDYTSGGRSLTVDASRLREDERLEFKYDQHKNLISIQKIKLSLFREPMEAKAETNITAGGFGQVFYQGSYWKARCDGESKVLKGQMVMVIARQDLTLLVLPAVSSV